MYWLARFQYQSFQYNQLRPGNRKLILATELYSLSTRIIVRNYGGISGKLQKKNYFKIDKWIYKLWLERNTT